MAMEHQNFSLYVGDTRILEITVKEENGTAVDLTNATIKWTLTKRRGTESLLTKRTGAGINVANPTSGVCTVHIDSADTKRLQPGDYIHMVQITDSSDQVSTVLEGVMSLSPSNFNV